MKRSVIVTSYNSPQFLKLLIDRVRQQILLPDEVVITDDGSRDKPRRLIGTEKRNFPVPNV